MQRSTSVSILEDLGRVRLSKSIFMRDMLYSEISNFYGIPNIPDNPGLAIKAGQKLCQELLEPLREQFGHISIRSAYRSSAVNDYGHKNKLKCGSNEYNNSKHIWDVLDKDGHYGATACIVVNNFIPYFERTGDWSALAWWIHDNLPYSNLCFYPKLAAFNIGWHEKPAMEIFSFVDPEGLLTKPSMENHGGDHSEHYKNMIDTIIANVRQY